MARNNPEARFIRVAQTLLKPMEINENNIYIRPETSTSSKSARIVSKFEPPVCFSVCLPACLLACFLVCLLVCLLACYPHTDKAQWIPMMCCGCLAAQCMHTLLGVGPNYERLPTSENSSGPYSQQGMHRLAKLHTDYFY